MGVIRRTYAYLDKNSFLYLCKALVRRHIEYANQVWASHLRKDIETIENVQCRGTKQIPGFRNLTYEERLKKLDLSTLCYLRKRGYDRNV